MAEFFNRQWRLPNNENKDKQSNYSMDFDGSSQQINSTSNLGISGASPRTFSAWMKTTDAGGGFDVIVATGNSGNTGNNFELDFRNNVIMWERWGLGIMGSVVVNDGSWHHACITYDGNILKLYVDGSEDTGGDFPYTIGVTTSTDTPVRIGGMNHSLKYFNGQIDAVSIFNYALSQGQITTLYGSSSIGIGNPMSLSPKPVAYYPLGDQDVYNSASYLVPNASLQDYVFGFAEPHVTNYPTPNTPIIAENKGSIFSNINNFSFSGWFNIPYYTYFFPFDIRDDNDNLYFNINMFSNQLRFNVGAGGGYIANLQNIVPTNTWFHYAGVFDGSGASNTDRLKLYIDGQPQTVVYNTTVPTSFPTIPSDADINLGKSYSVMTYTTMLSSNIQLWDSSLTPSEVKTVYNNGSPLQTLSNVPQNSNLELWWKLNTSATFDGNNWSIPDDSSNSNTGTSNGMTQSALQQSDLQYTSGYSPYALQLDGTSNYFDVSNFSSVVTNNDITLSMWFKTSLTSPQYLIATSQTFGTSCSLFMPSNGSGELWFRRGNNTGGGEVTCKTSSGYNDDKWHNVICTSDSNMKIYVNGVLDIQSTTSTPTVSDSQFLTIGVNGGSGTSFFDGKLSNVSIWNSALTSSQVTEVYNSGVPSNLNNHSAVSSLVSWWQLGSNSSFNSNSWTVLDEKGTNDGVSSTNMSEVDIVNGVGYSSNGVSSGMSDNLKGSAPYSTANSLSINMDVLDRTTDIPN
jgi:hypothetical protein